MKAHLRGRELILDGPGGRCTVPVPGQRLKHVERALSSPAPPAPVTKKAAKKKAKKKKPVEVTDA